MSPRLASRCLGRTSRALNAALLSRPSVLETPTFLCPISGRSEWGWWLWLGKLGGVVWIAGVSVLLGQVPALPSNPSSGGPASVRSGPPLPQLATLPPVPRVRTPTDRFRELLAANAEQREVLLSRKPPAARALIEAKLREFGGLRPDEREIRLRLAQFQDSLRTLLPLSPPERGPVMASVPEEDLPWIEERLAAWDQLPESERRDVLESERRLSWFVRQAGAEPDRRSAEAYVATLPPAAQQAAREQMERWLALPSAERARKAAAFPRFFHPKASEREAAPGPFSPPRPHPMETAFRDFWGPAPAARVGCGGWRKCVRVSFG